MTELLVTEYDLAEQEAISELPNRIVEAYEPVIFHKLGYPSRVRYESELFKYIDVMHELRFEEVFADILGGLTENEFELLQRLTELVCRFSESRFGRKALARSSVLLSLNVLRHIRYLFGEARPRVFEIGPGSGYLGAMLMLEGYPYAATDVSQVFYLYQNHFWNFVSDGKVLELVRDNISHESLAEPPPGGVVHVPWWEFVRLRPESVPQFDVVTCNHTLCEMHPDSLGFAVMIAQASLHAKESLKAFLFEGWGYDGRYLHASVTRRFYRSGFALVHNDSQITVFAPNGTEGTVECLSLPKRSTRQFRRLRNVLRRLAGAAPLTGGDSYSYAPCHYVSPRNPLSQAILWGRQSEQGVRTVKIDQVNRFYTDLLGSEDHLGPDEHFWKLIDHGG